MDAEKARKILLRLPHTIETMQWGANLVFWAGDKAIGGKMFALIDLDGTDGPVACFAAGPERFAELQELEGFRPAPYLARAHWIAAERWGAFADRQWEREFAAAHAVVFGKLSKRTRDVLALPVRERTLQIAERRLSLVDAAPRKPRVQRRSGSPGAEV